MATFHVRPSPRFEGSNTTIRRPRHFLEFSFDRKHQLHIASDQSLRYYYPPYIESSGVQPPLVKLTNGFESWERSDDTLDGHLNALLGTLQAHEEQRLRDGASAEEARVKADVITWRGMMTKILTAGYDSFSDFEMNATCYQGTIFIEENHPYALADKQTQNRQPTPHGQDHEMMQYCGYKFEALSVLARPWGEVSRDEINARDNEIVNTNEQYCSIVRTGIGSTSLIIAGEVDCIMGEKPDNLEDPIPWVELKTTADQSFDSPRDAQKFERKLLRFWAQSFLLGVPKVIVGFRSPRGELVRMKEFETQKIPSMVSRNQRTWDGNVCINLTAAFLEFLKATVLGSEGVWRIKRVKFQGDIVVWKVQETGTGGILAESFKAHRERLIAMEVAAKLGGGKNAD